MPLVGGVEKLRPVAGRAGMPFELGKGPCSESWVCALVRRGPAPAPALVMYLVILFLQISSQALFFLFPGADLDRPCRLVLI